MIEFVSGRLISFLVNKNAVSKNSEDEIAYYKYGVEITLSSILNIVLIILIGLILGCIAESIIFLSCFITLRQFTGGYHADSYFKCNMTFCAVFLIVISLYTYTWQSIGVATSVLTGFLCLIIICISCPIENINKPIKDERKNKLKYISLLLSGFLFLISILLITAKHKFGALTLYTLYSVTALIIVAKLKKGGYTNESDRKI
ncbi:MAG: accessory gene regulator B family protein [Oscillospiraceae bacterium]|nr:accessory gene regulator B family protein [Oscillospiraceae bacterium]